MTIYKRNNRPSEMAVFKKAKELISATFDLSENWPKKYRFDLTSRVRNTAIDVYEKLIEANEIYIDTKLLEDLRKSVKFLKNQIEESKVTRSDKWNFAEFKLLTLRLIEANKQDERITKRRDKQNQAFAALKKLDFFFIETYTRQLINVKKWEKVSGLISEITILLKAWIKSDRKRFEV